jgi:hypothetical protein
VPIWGDGNIDQSPEFVNSVEGDFHLQYTSPCRNAGDNAAPGHFTEDMEGDPRIAEGVVDMGADEFHRHLYYTGDAVPAARSRVAKSHDSIN